MLCVENITVTAERAENDLAAFVPTQVVAYSRGKSGFPRDLTIIIRNASLMYSTANRATFLNKGGDNSVERVEFGVNHLHRSRSLQIPDRSLNAPGECKLRYPHSL